MIDDRHRQYISEARQVNQVERLTRREAPPPAPRRIEERDPVTGTWRATYPDGSPATGQKVFDSRTQAGDPAIALPARSGGFILLGPKAEPAPLEKLEEKIIYRRPEDAPPPYTNEVGYHWGQLWNYPQASKTVENLKYLWSKTEGDQILFLVGGWKKDNYLAKSLPVGTEIFHASVDNLGGDRWAVNLGYVEDGKVIVERVGNNPWRAEVPTLPTTLGHSYDPLFPECYGHGFWRSPEYGTADTYFDAGSYDSRIYSGGRHWFAFNGKSKVLLMEPYSIKGLLVDFSATTGFPFDGEVQTIWNYQAPTIALPGDRKFSTPLRLLNTNNFVHVDGKIYNVFYERLTGLRRFYQVYRINAAGNRGVGKVDRKIDQPLMAQAKTVWFQGRSAQESPQAFDFAAHWVDVQASGFTAIKRSPAPDLTQDRPVEVAFYSKSFKAKRKKKIKLFKLDRPGGESFTLYNVSYAATQRPSI